MVNGLKKVGSIYNYHEDVAKELDIQARATQLRDALQNKYEEEHLNGVIIATETDYKRSRTFSGFDDKEVEYIGSCKKLKQKF